MTTPKLRDVIDEILRLKKPEGWTQAILGEKIGVNQSMVSKMRYGPDWQQHWEVMLKLLPICADLGIEVTQCFAPTVERIVEETIEYMEHLFREQKPLPKQEIFSVVRRYARNATVCKKKPATGYGENENVSPLPNGPAHPGQTRKARGGRR